MVKKLNKKIDAFLTKGANELLNSNVFYEKIKSSKLIFTTKLTLFWVLVILFFPEVILFLAAWWLKTFFLYYLVGAFALSGVVLHLIVRFWYLKIRISTPFYKKLLAQEKAGKTKENAWKVLSKTEISAEIEKLNQQDLVKEEDLKALYLWKNLSCQKRKQIRQVWKKRMQKQEE